MLKSITNSLLLKRAHGTLDHHLGVCRVQKGRAGSWQACNKRGLARTVQVPHSASDGGLNHASCCHWTTVQSARPPGHTTSILFLPSPSTLTPGNQLHFSHSCTPLPPPPPPACSIPLTPFTNQCSCRINTQGS